MPMDGLNLPLFQLKDKEIRFLQFGSFGLKNTHSTTSYFCAGRSNNMQNTSVVRCCECTSVCSAPFFSGKCTQKERRSSEVALTCMKRPIADWDLCINPLLF
ncbi:hypothetical protein XENOCAPTIV_015495 [Xenoophorus captivus]|uniref:Uncharacterized protein n=1 Tax=Xenoophorus captivus TaxID=1517983 RepID=A0ABV0RA71_9TELE